MRDAQTTKDFYEFLQLDLVTQNKSLVNKLAPLLLF